MMKEFIEDLTCGLIEFNKPLTNTHSDCDLRSLRDNLMHLKIALLELDKSIKTKETECNDR